VTVSELIAILQTKPGDAQVALATRHGEAEEFTVEDADDGWVVLDG
jgi:hypothetical protein